LKIKEQYVIFPCAPPNLFLIEPVKLLSLSLNYCGFKATLHLSSFANKKLINS